MEKMGKDKEAYPGVDLAYEFVLPSYDWARDRLDSINGRLQAMQGFAVTVTLAVPVFARSVTGNGIDFGSGWFMGAMLTFLVLMVVGLVARARGTLALLDPHVLYEHYLEWGPWEFRKNVLYWAGEHAQLNHDLVIEKGKAINWMTGLFIAESLLLVLWIATA